MYPTDPTSLHYIGRSAADLLASIDTWITRRKEAVTVVDETIVRRHMSIDFDLPPWVKSVHKSRNNQPVYYAPLFMLQKGSDDVPEPGRIMIEPPPHFAAFDVRSSLGEAMSLPPRYWNASVSIEALKVVFLRASAEQGVPLGVHEWRWITELLEHICRQERNESVRMLEELKYHALETIPSRYHFIRTLVANDDMLDWLLEACAKSSVAMVPLVGETARQGIVKISYNEQMARLTVPWSLKTLRVSGDRRTLAKIAASRLGWAGYEFWIDTPFIGASNYHVEVAAPEGLEVYDAGLIEVAEDPRKARAQEGNVTLSRVSGLASEVHLYAPDAGRGRGALTWVRLRVRRDELLGAAFAVAVLIAGLLWTAHFVADEIKQSPRGVPELLLLFPGAVAAYVTRPGRHRLTAWMVRWARVILVLVSAMPYLAAASFALAQHNKHGQIVSDSFKGPLHGLAIAALVGAVALGLSRFSPQPLIRRQRVDRRLGLRCLRRRRRALTGAVRNGATRLGSALKNSLRS